MVEAFDAAKYERLMNGLEAVEMKLSEVKFENESYRIDSEYFKKEFLLNEEIIKNKPFNLLNDIIELLTDGKHGGVELTEYGVLFLRNTNIKSDVIDLSDKRFISETESAETKRAELKPNDVLITTIGTIVGESVVIPNGFPKATINQNLVRVVPKDKTVSCHMSSFINSIYGSRQVYRMAVGNIWYLVNYPNLRNLKVPIRTIKFYEAINFVHGEAEDYLSKSKSLYYQAETLLLDELGLHNWQPKEANTAIKTYKNSFFHSGRLDAEYYQPKYDELIEKINSVAYDYLQNLVIIRKSKEPGSDAYMEAGVPFIRVSNLSKYGLTAPDIFLYKQQFDNLENLYLKKDSVLLTKDGSVGIAYKMDEDLDAVTSGAILHLTINNKKIIPDYLALVLNSVLVQMQAERDAGGSIIQHWRSNEIEQVLIPIIDIKKQLEIAALVQQTFALKKQSQHLLNTAKQAVEIAIEESEEAAIQWINKQTENYDDKDL